MDHAWIRIKPSTECELEIFNWRYKILQQNFIDVVTVKILSAQRIADETGLSWMLRLKKFDFCCCLVWRGGCLISKISHETEFCGFGHCNVRALFLHTSIFSLLPISKELGDFFFNRIWEILNSYEFKICW